MTVVSRWDASLRRACGVSTGKGCGRSPGQVPSPGRAPPAGRRGPWHRRRRVPGGRSRSASVSWTSGALCPQPAVPALENHPEKSCARAGFPAGVLANVLSRGETCDHPGLPRTGDRGYAAGARHGATGERGSSCPGECGGPCDTRGSVHLQKREVVTLLLRLGKCLAKHCTWKPQFYESYVSIVMHRKKMQ